MCRHYLAALRSYAGLPQMIGIAFTLVFVVVFLQEGWDDEPHRDGRVFLACMCAFFVFLSALALLIHVRYQLATPYCTVLPHFRKGHAGIGLFMGVLLVAAYTTVLTAFDVDLLGGIAISAITLSLTLCLTHLSLAGTGCMLGLSLATIAHPDGRQHLWNLLAGEATTTAVIMVVLSIVLLGIWFYRLLCLREESWETNSGWQNLPSPDALATGTHLTHDAGVGRTLDRINGYAGIRPLDRIRHRQLAYSGVAPWLYGLIPVLLATPFLAFWRYPEFVKGVLYLFLPLSVTVLAVFPISQMPSRSRMFELESLFPSSRPMFIRETGLAIAKRTLEAWVSMALASTLMAAIAAPRLFSLVGLVLLLLSLGTVVFFMGLAAYLSSRIGQWAIFSAIPTYIALQVYPYIKLMITPELVECMPIWLTLTILLILSGLKLAGLAYRRWCERELGQTRPI